MGMSVMSKVQGSKVGYFLSHPTFITIIVLIMVIFFISDVALIYYYAFVQ